MASLGNGRNRSFLASQYSEDGEPTGLPDLKKMRIDEEPDMEFNNVNILDRIQDVHNWKELGVQLEISLARLKEIEQCDGDPKMKMITTWKELDCDASWDKLQRALESPAMCENRVSKGIAERRGSSFDNDALLSQQSSPRSYHAPG